MGGGAKIRQLRRCELAIFEIAANGHTCEVFSHANQLRISGGSSTILVSSFPHSFPFEKAAWDRQIKGHEIITRDQ